MPSLRPVSLFALALLAGCSTGSLSLQIPIAGQQTVMIDFSGGNPVNAENGDVRVEKSNLILDSKTKQGSYVFAFLQKNRRDQPARVKVEDVTDDTAVTLVDDRTPRLADGHWQWKGEPMTFDATNAKWLFEIENSVRVYRFTIETANGNEWILYQAATYPAFVKTYLRQQLGLEAKPGAAR